MRTHKRQQTYQEFELAEAAAANHMDLVAAQCRRFERRLGRALTEREFCLLRQQRHAWEWSRDAARRVPQVLTLDVLRTRAFAREMRAA